MKIEKKRILIVTGLLYAGGAEMFVRNLCRCLDPSLFTIHVCMLYSKSKSDLDCGITSFFYLYHKPMLLIRTLIRLQSVIRTLQPHCVMSSIGETNRLVGTLLSISSVPVMWICRIAGNPQFDGRRKLSNYVNRLWNIFVYKRVCIFVTNSEGLYRTIVSLYHKPSSKVLFLKNPINFQKLHRLSSQNTSIKKPGNTFLIISVGRIHRAKRHDVLISAIERIHHQIPCTVWICGDGHLMKSMQHLCKKKHLDTIIQFWGYCTNPYPLLKQADALVLSSDHEGMPNVVIEAMCLGVVPIASNCPFGPAELIDHGKNGFLFPPGDSNRLALQLISYYYYKNKKELQNAAQKKIQSLYSYTEQTKQWNDFFCTYSSG